MKFLNIKIPFIIVVLIFLIISGGLGIFYWQKIYLPPEVSTPSDVSLETVQEECIADVNQMTDEELISQIKELKYPHIETDIVGSDGVLKDRMSLGQNQMSKYLICKVGVDPGNEGIYNKAKKFIEESKFEEEYKENKQFYFSMLEDESKKSSLALLEEGSYPGNNFITLIAFAPLESICDGDQATAEFLEIDKEFFDNSFKDSDLDNNTLLELEEQRQEKVNKLCGIINKYKGDSSLFVENEIKDDWSQDEDILIKTGIPARVSLGFRLGGKDLSLEVCNSIPESMTKAKNSCREKIEYLIDSEDCSGIRGELTDLICEYN